MIKIVTNILILLLVCGVVQAQHSIDIQKLTAQGQHYEALVQFDKMAKRQAMPDALIAGAKSAWALGLTDRAILGFEESLRIPNLSNESRARLLLSRGAIEFQEQRYQVAALFAERVVKLLPTASALRAKAYLLWGESLYHLGSYAPALEQYQKALNEQAPETLADASFLTGRCLVRLGSYSEAQSHLEAVPVTHERTPEAIRLLAVIGLETKNYKDVDFWLERGKDQHSDYFLDSWVDFAMVTAALGLGDLERAYEIQQLAENRFPPSDEWLNLLQAAVETSHWHAKAKLTEQAS